VRDPVAGKTGTTNSGTDVWFVGYTPTLVAGFWFGYDEPRPLGRNPSGGRLAAPAWAEFYRDGWRERGGDWTAPAGLAQRSIDPYTGYLASEFCPTVEREWFRQGTEPTESCPEHLAPPEPDPWDSQIWAQPAPGSAPPAVEEARQTAKKAEKWFKRVFKW
jgi:penicillin-binding protein 1A